MRGIERKMNSNWCYKIRLTEAKGASLAIDMPASREATGVYAIELFSE